MEKKRLANLLYWVAVCAVAAAIVMCFMRPIVWSIVLWALAAALAAVSFVVDKQAKKEKIKQ